MSYIRTRQFSGINDRVIANTTTEMSLFPSSSVGPRTIANDSMEIGDSISVRGGGIFTTALVPGNLTVRVKMGSTVIGSGVISALLTSAVNNAFAFSLDIVYRTLGASGTVMVDGHLNYAASGATSRLWLDINNTGSTMTIDTTSPQTFDISVQWASTGLGANSITLTKIFLDTTF